jgi:ATP-dependent helicase/nuclease subunit A
MSGPNFDAIQLARVVSRQREGADAHANAWVSASAGAGKTRVLRDRVLRLLLAGVRPERILCLTFTKAAAAEMARRINDELGQWTVAGESELARMLEELYGTSQEPEMLVRARRLFAQVLDAPGGMKIMTIHSFCQSVLRRFPLEAGVVPHFQVMEERDAGELLENAKADLLLAASDPDRPLHDAVAELAGRVHEVKFPDLLGEIARARGKFQELLNATGGVPGARARLAGFFDIDPDLTEAELLSQACDDTAFELSDLRRVVAALADGSKGDQDRARIIAAWLAADIDDRAAMTEAYGDVFITRSGSVRKTLATKPVITALADAGEVLAREADRLLALRDQLRKVNLLAANTALLHVAQALTVLYEARKAGRGRLDYDDLIARTRDLLRGDGAAAWVLFKLDGGIDHVLIDEAQDTNPEQWDVVGALVEEFFAGMSARDEALESLGLPERSVFAVGDVKQSIYSFQGAEPRRFREMRDYLSARSQAAKAVWRNVALDFSFRSARPVLEAVDKVFSTAFARAGVVAADEDDLRHTPLREVDAGRVELWPAVISEKPEEPEPWKPPVDPVSLPGTMDQLAGLIARQISDWLAKGELLESEGRPIEAGDVLVLVRQRGAFVESLVRALKSCDVPVAGVDRMVLTEQIAVMDLLALGEFLLLPEDDLNLATLLKSPMLGFDEEMLFDLAHDRGEISLWAALQARRDDVPAFGAAVDYLDDLRGRVDLERPYELFAGVLSRGGRARIYERLGPDAADPVDEFLSLALSFESTHTPSLQNFLHWLAAGDAQVKRDLDQTGGAVRVMTVHGAKGLEAPIVFLPDTTRLPRSLPSLLWNADSDTPFAVWLPRIEDADAQTLALRENVRLQQMEEHRRLLYVAMTRAEERLYVAGWNEPGEGSWYALVQAAMNAIAQPVESPFLSAAGVPDPMVLRLDAAQRGPVSGSDARAVSDIPALPGWVHAPAPDEPDPPRPLAPSDPGENPPVRAPVERVEDQQRFVRGNILHRLLQWLPELDASRRHDAALRYLARPVFELPENTQHAIAGEVLAVLEQPEFAHLFGPDSVAEVAITGTAPRADGTINVISGQIDRLVMSSGVISIVDYKSNRPPPDDPEAVAPVYLRQMAAYRHVIRAGWPDHGVRAYLLWTDTPHLMEIPDPLLDQYGPDLHTSL